MNGKRLVMWGGLLAAVSVLACSSVVGDAIKKPGHVTDLQLIATASGSVTLRWTQVSDGDDVPARYLVAYSTGPIAWAPVSVSTVPVTGTAIGAPREVTIDNLNRATNYNLQLVSYRGALDSAPAFGEPSNLVLATTDADEPGSIEDLSFVTSTTTTASVSWTEVDDGAGSAASYLVAIGAAPLNWTTARPTAQTVMGTAVGGTKSLTLTGLAPATAYQVQVASVRGIPSDTSTLGVLSNSVAVQTQAVGAPTPFFTDNFDTGSRTNANGFTWNSTSNRVSVSSTVAFSGTHALRFDFGPDTTGGDSSAEQRFNLGRNITEIWIDLLLYVPSNYAHRSESPSNNKFIRIWGDDYNSDNKVGASTWASGGNPIGSTLRIDRRTTSGMGPSGGGPSSTAAPTVPYGITKGAWTRVRMHFRHTTSYAANSAIAEIWFGDVKVTSWTDLNQFFDAARPYWNQGYLFGWANSGFTILTQMYVDDVKFYDTNPGW